LEAEHVRRVFAVPLGEKGTLVGLKLQAGPTGATIAERLTFPENPLRLVRVTTEEFDEPGNIVSESKFDDIE